MRPSAPIDLQQTLGPLRIGHHDPTIVLSPGDVWRATRTPEGPATVHLEARDGRIDVEAWGDGAAWALEAADDLIGLHDDPAAFDPGPGLLRDLHRRNPGLRIGASAAVLELLVPTILGQKVTGIEQKRAWNGIVRRYGEPAPGPRELIVPPAAATLAELPYFAYHPMGVERRRADVIRNVCARASRIEEAATMPSVDAQRRLRAFPGVGPWTAAIVARVALGDADAVEVADFHLPNLVSWNLADEPRGDDDRMLELLEPHRGQRGRVIRLLELGGERAPRYGPRMPIRRLAAL
ncbi:MAG: DNA-3-methyladenine glycosylase 2 family protein [Actinobacteria bacterium]|nr:DNA-3-methyladenine glycosylase 2 family protein [Actinomycetota bacterium]